METSYRRMIRRLSDLRTEFKSSWDPHLRELYQQMAPRRARWNRTDFNRGDKINGAIINNTPLLALRTFSAGFMASVTSPMREWFRLTTPDPDLNDWAPVKAYLHAAQERLRWAFAMGSYYQGLADGIYPDLGVAGFSHGLMTDHPKRIMTLRMDAIGEFYLSANADDVVDTVYREIPMTVRQMVWEFGLRHDELSSGVQGTIDWSRLSGTVKNLWDSGKLEQVVDVVNVIQPNLEFSPGRLGAEGMRWASVWFEAKAEREERFLRQAGYDDFPSLAPRWSARGGEAYGRSAGMDVLGDCKQLQHHERRLAELIDKSSKPPMVADEAMDGRRLSLVPGDTVYAPRGTVDAFKPAFQVQPAAVAALLEHIQRVEGRIDEGLFANLFARVLRDERNQRATAREIEEMSQEVASLLGPHIERLNGELYAPSIERGWGLLDRRGLLPEAPPELDGIEVKPEFISVLHQAQKGVGIQPIRIFLGEVGALSSLRPDALDKLRADEIVDELANATGVKPSLVMSDEEVAEVRAQRAKREEALQQAQAMSEMAQGAATVAGAPAADTSNLLGQVLSAVDPSGATAGANAPLGPIATAGFRGARA